MSASNLHLSDELLARYLANTATADEIERVRLWLEASPERADELAGYRKLWESNGSLRPDRLRVDTDAAWQNVRSRMHKPQVPEVIQRPLHPAAASEKPLPTRRLAPGYWAAAVVALLVVSFSWLLLNRTQPTQLVTITTHDNTFEKVLPDGTKVFLNYHSTLTYSDGLPGDTRAVSLRGEAFFDVQPDATHPFVIDANGTEVRVLGTSFNVKAYDEAVRVDVKTGRVEVAKASRKAVLAPGEGVAVEADTVLRPLLADPNIGAYRTQVFDFQATPLADIVASLRDGYHADVRLGNAQLAHCRFTWRFERESLDVVLSVIAEALDLRVQQEGTTYRLEGTACQSSL
ncbi:FecR domain-containing protein [Rhabdobacter roseus]|uniref:Ferric-dicitrate binding protein FerR (Iron transport regulator) n=1 Tax=Rhabdobacter roseus TaxID=1655419 RepID=A0A840U2Y9_9BACT|nr:FecR domain-containing protein [Rhabdobacter roseus]MBB5286209.1 ferric-dicitrate binding protein FerR (iron transport regulator) [Rhabdobacter roseus]